MAKYKKVNNLTLQEAFEWVLVKLKEDFKYQSDIIKYSTTRYYPCHNGSDCCKDDYCRCSTITCKSITDQNTSKLIEYATADIKDITNSNLNIFKYAVDRIVANSNLYSDDSWDLKIEPGYYGEEVDELVISEHIINLISDRFNILSTTQTTMELIMGVLQYEYEHILPSLLNLNNVDIVDVDINKVMLNNDTYMRKVSKEPDYYKDYNLPRAVCTKDGDYYKLIDGYHRVTSAKKNNINKFKVILLS